MKFLILMGSPRIHGNTAELCKPFIETLARRNADVRYIPLAQKDIRPCLGCYVCQDIDSAYGCVQQDDMTEIVQHIQWADCIVLATPIYAWYCAAPMKALLDRHYGLNKFYGSATGSLWAGKQLAILATHGYPQDNAVAPFEMGMKNLCDHSHLIYKGLYSVQDEDNLASFQSEQAVAGAKTFALSLLQ